MTSCLQRQLWGVSITGIVCEKMEEEEEEKKQNYIWKMMCKKKNKICMGTSGECTSEWKVLVRARIIIVGTHFPSSCVFFESCCKTHANRYFQPSAWLCFLQQELHSTFPKKKRRKKKKKKKNLSAHIRPGRPSRGVDQFNKMRRSPMWSYYHHKCTNNPNTLNLVKGVKPVLT